MKTSKYLFPVITGVIITLSIFNLFEVPAVKFVSDVSEKNLSFLALVSEVKLVLSGISKIDVPFINGDTGEISSSLDKVQDYLLAVNAISLLQLMLLTISKSWIIKLFMILLFILSFFTKSKLLCSKLLILTLAVSPGLSVYSVVVQQLSKEASIDFGDTYLNKLKASVQSIKSEKAELMKEHARNLNQISNGEKGVVFFRKLKEDVSYDFKDAADNIKGDYTQIRLLLHEAGQEMVRKIFIFCTTVLFCLFILPVGYALLIFTLYKTLFQTANIHNPLNYLKDNTDNLRRDIKSVASNSSLFTRFRNMANVMKNELNKPQSIKSDIVSETVELAQKEKGKVQDSRIINNEEDDIKNLASITNVTGKARNIFKKSEEAFQGSGIINEIKNNAENVPEKSNISSEIKEFAGNVENSGQKILKNNAETAKAIAAIAKTEGMKKAGNNLPEKDDKKPPFITI